MTLQITDDDGNTRTVTRVIAYDCLCEEDVECVEEDLDIELTEEQRKKVARYAERSEYFPSMDDLREIVRNVQSGYFD